MMYIGDYPADQAIYFMWNTNDASGGSITRATDGTLSVYKDASNGTAFDLTQVTTGITNDEDVDGLTGVHSCCITTTDAWYETGHDYVVVLSASTIDGETVNAVIATFSIENRYMVGTDSAYTGTPPTVIQIRQEMDTNSTKMAPSQTLNDYKATGFSTHSAANVWAVGTRALTDKAGFSLSTAGIDAIWDDLIAGMTAVGSIGKLIADNLNAAITSRAPSGEYNTQMGYIPSNLGDVPTATELNSAHGAGSWATATGFSTHNAAAVWSVAVRILTANTNFNDLDAAAIKAEVAAALQDIKLDHLLNIAVDTDWATTVHLNSVIGHMADVGTAATFDRTTDALEALRSRGDAAWVTATGFNTTTPPTVIQIRQEMDANSTKMAPSQVLADYKATGFSTHSAANVWSVGTRALTDKAGFALSTAGIKAIWDQLTAALTTVGSIGKLLVDNINATISSRNSTTPPTVGAIRTEMEGVGTKLTEILEDTGTTLDAMIERILGLDQENFYIDNTVFTGANMTSCRIRIYSVAGSVGTASDVIATYNMTTTYAGDNLASYKMVKA